MNSSRNITYKLVKHYHEPGDFHELTFSCYHSKPLLTNDCWRTELSRCIDIACEQAQMELVAFVYMPEHVHLLVFPLIDKPDLGFFLNRVKEPLSKFVKEALIKSKSKLLDKLTIRERPGKTCFRFWQEGPGYDRNLHSAKAIEGSIAYIHRNPCARKLCQRAIDWRWSSARYYLLEPPCQQFPEIPHIHGLRPETFDPDHKR